MARKRMLDPMIWDDPDLAVLSPVERLLFIGMVSLSDDYGHIAGNPALLRKWVFGYDDYTIEQVTAMRDAILRSCRNVALYSVDGQDYIWLKTWERHQDLRFRAKAQYPCHACGCYHTIADYRSCQTKPATPQAPPPEQSGASAQPLRTSTQDIAQPLPPDYVTLDQELLSDTCANPAAISDESSRRQPLASAAPNGAQKPIPIRKPKAKAEEPPEGFDQFWALYPRKIGKAPALEAFRRIIKAGTDPPSAICLGVEHYVAECRLVGREMQFICYPVTFLRQRRWVDHQKPPDPKEYMPRPIRGVRQADTGPKLLTPEEAARAYPDYR